MAAAGELNKKSVFTSDVDILLHPELLSQDFMQLMLSERNVSTGECGSRDRLTEMYLRHVVPLPQRTLPNNRWGRRMERTPGRQTAAGHRADSSSNDHHRKRPLIVFEGSSSHPGSLKVKKPDGSTASLVTDRLKPPPAANLSNPIRKLNSSSSSSTTHRTTDAASLKREANSSSPLKSPEVKKKIQHVTWP
ncbi:ashwin [Kryptolebias marmoratus]|uniref:Ashwin n=1 Tax=Kryptolebias marmoratus TaxID=37003 RepID=A0A3Q2ZET4_KRYMA|nr:ashwin [Kryptolebias marmoratus]